MPDKVNRLLKGIDCVVYVIIFQQSAPFCPQLRQLCADLIKLSSAGISVQQSSCLKLADVIALLTCLGNGLVHGQHSGIAPLDHVSEFFHLFYGRQQDNSRIALQLVVHPHEGPI